MTTLKKLLDRYCSENVQYVQLGEVVSYEQPTKYLVKSTDYDDTFETPVLTPGKTFLLGYTDETNGIYDASPAEPVIIFDDFTTANKWVDFPFKCKSSAMKLLTPKSESISLRFAFLAMQDLEVDTTDHKRQWIRTFSKELIPFPPREVQDEIVEILDTFAALCENLDTEITQREQQFAAYREKLLSVDYLTHQHCPTGVRYARLEDIVSYEQPTKYLVSSTDYDDSFATPVLTAGKTFLLGYTDEENGIYEASPASPVIIFDDFTTANKWVDFPFKTKSSAMKILTTNDETISLKFVFLAMHDVEVDTTDHKRQWIRTFSKQSIPLPPREVQEEIVAKLDAMQALIDNLRLEREQRQQQFDYYREKLLSFPQKETAEV